MVLLGVRSALKVDLECTAAELVYGTSLRLPGDFFPTSASLSTLDPTTYVTSLKSMMQTLHGTLILIYIQATLARLFPSVPMCLFDMMRLGHHCRPPTMAPIKFWTAHPSTLLLILRVDDAPSDSNRHILISVQSTMRIFTINC